MRVLVCGGRGFGGRDWLFAVLDLIHERRVVAEVIHGAARGADVLAGEWARARGVTETPITADWRKFGRAAGPIRNALMLKVGKPDVVVAFPGGRGTAHMMEIARAGGVPVYEPPNPQAYVLDGREAGGA